MIVADTDTGMNLQHPDLYDNVWINQAEIPASVLPNLTDVYDDGVITFTDLNNPVNQGSGKITDTNGVGIITGDRLARVDDRRRLGSRRPDTRTATPLPIPDDLIGWNFARQHHTHNNPLDGNGHGTFTASEIAEVGNNGIGAPVSTGTCSSCRFSSSTPRAAAPTRRRPRQSSTRSTTAPRSSTPVGAAPGRIPPSPPRSHYADQNGVIIVAAAGNNGTDDDNSSTWFSPASYSVGTTPT